MTRTHVIETRLRLRQRVAVIDPAPISREHARRAIRMLGHAPFLFDGAADLRAMGRGARPFAMVILNCPMADLQAARLARETLEFVGPDILLLTMVRDKRHQTSRAFPGEVIVTPSGFSEMYAALAAFAIRHRFAITGSTVECQNDSSVIHSAACATTLDLPLQQRDPSVLSFSAELY
jgi:hypothetical protein